MYYWDYIYSRDKNCIISLDTSTNKYHKIPKGFLDAKIFSSNGTPIRNAYIRISVLDEFNEFTLKINALGYHPVQINNVQFYPGLLCKLNINLNPIQYKNKILNHYQVINLPTYENAQCFQNTSELQQDEIRDLSFTLGISSPSDNLFYLYAEKFAAEVYALSNGKMKIDVFPDGELGADRQMLRTVIQNGYPDFLVQTTAFQVDFVPKLSVFDMPMVYDDIEYLRNTFNDDIFYKKINDAYSDSGYKLLGISDMFFRQMTSNKIIQGIEDFEGIKIRTIQNKNHETFWESLGSIVTPMPFSEIYPSIKFEYIDAEENSYEVIDGLKLYEVQKYLINTRHLPHVLSLITSNTLYNSLTTAEKAIIDEAAINATLYLREEVDESLEERKRKLIDNGMMLVDLPEETKQAMRTAALTLYEKIREIVGDDVLIDAYFQNSNFN